MEDTFRSFMDLLAQTSEPTGGFVQTAIRYLLGFIILLAVSATAYVITQLLLKGIRKFITGWELAWSPILIKHRVLQRASHIVPAFVIYNGCQIALPGWSFNSWIQRLAMAYMGIAIVLLLTSILRTIVDVYRTFEISKGRPIKGLMQTFEIGIWLVGGITVLAILMDQSPWQFLTGIGALSAVLLLVFKDSILGLVASFQISANRMVHLGDWIEMPQHGVDGNVIDISLNTVKVQNWDNTISTIPTYALVADAVKNWRGMDESEGRRIKRSINLDMHTVRFCTDTMLNRFEKYALLADELKNKRSEIKEHNEDLNVDTDSLINGRRITNLGAFRSYLVQYLRNHPMIHKDMTFLVRQLAPTDRGIPLEIYVFSRDKAWANYENIQADIFDHVIAAAPEFDLAVFQSPSGRDFRNLALKDAVSKTGY